MATLLDKAIKIIDDGAGTGGVQLRVGYSGSQYVDVMVASSGAVTFAGTGTLPSFTFNAGVAVQGILTATGFSGAFNGTVGAITPAAGAFTTGAFSGAVTVYVAAGSGYFVAKGANAQNTGLQIQNAAGTAHWTAYSTPGAAGQIGTFQIRESVAGVNAVQFAATTGNALFGGAIQTVGDFTIGSPAVITLAATGNASFAAGAVDACSLARTGDLHTGFWFPADNTIAASVNGVEGLRLTTTGLTVVGTLASAALTTNGGLQTFLANDSAGAGFRYVVVPNSA